MDDSQVRTARSAATLLFAGALVLIIDVEVDGLDVVNDVIGAGLVAVGAGRLAQVAALLGNRAGTWAFALAVVDVVVAVLIELDGDAILEAVSGTVSLVGVLLTAVAFEHIARTCADDDLVRGWRTTRLLVAFLYGVPWVLLLLWSMTDPRLGSDASGSLALLVLIGAVPLVMLMVTLWRTRNLQAGSTDTTSPTLQT